MTDSMQTEKEMKASATENEMKVPQPRLKRGGMSALITMCNAIAPLYDAGNLTFERAAVSYVEPISKRSRYARQGVLFVELKCTLQT